jgi:hypothetical protein
MSGLFFRRVMGGWGTLEYMADPDGRVIDSAPLPDYSKDGVDLTLIRWTLSLSPAERLQFLEERINEILAIRELNAGN